MLIWPKAMWLRIGSRASAGPSRPSATSGAQRIPSRRAAIAMIAHTAATVASVHAVCIPGSESHVSGTKSSAANGG